MRTLPLKPYTGYTVILDAPSRFDVKSHRLLSGKMADWFEDSCLTPPHTLDSIEARTMDCRDSFLPGTRFITVHGAKAAERYNGILDRHGYPLVINGIAATVAYLPQDCDEHRSFEIKDEDDNDDPTTDRDIKDTAPTRRKNWRFWTAWHIRKLLTTPPVQLPALIPRLRPPLVQAIQALDAATGEDLYLDIETSRLHGCITCIGFSTSSSFPTVFVVPVYEYDGNLSYHEFYKFHRALSRAMLRNTTVAHNGSGFDFPVLRFFYKFPFPADPYDTMLANHRCFPEIEKSLAHLIGQWTWLPYHKDQNIEPRSHEQDLRQWNYNAKDVYALKPIKDAQLAFAADDPGLLASIAQSNASIVPYADTSRIGMRLDLLKLSVTSQELERQKNLYQRIASILVGKPFNPGSSDQCRKFFNDTLNYTVIARTDAGKSAMGAKQLYQLMIKYNNPLIPVILKYREAAKDLSNLESELFEEP